MAVQLTGLIAGYWNGLDPVFPGSRVLRMGCFQYFQDTGFLEWVVSSISRIQGSLNGLFSVFPGFRVIKIDCFPVFPGFEVIRMVCSPICSNFRGVWGSLPRKIIFTFYLWN